MEQKDNEEWSENFDETQTLSYQQIKVLYEDSQSSTEIAYYNNKISDPSKQYNSLHIPSSINLIDDKFKKIFTGLPSNITRKSIPTKKSRQRDGFIHSLYQLPENPSVSEIRRCINGTKLRKICTVLNENGTKRLNQ